MTGREFLNKHPRVEKIVEDSVRESKDADDSSKEAIDRLLAKLEKAKILPRDLPRKRAREIAQALFIA